MCSSDLVEHFHRQAVRVGRGLQHLRRHGGNQAGLGHALTRLRDLFEDPLFVRRPHGFEPTRRALALGPQVDALIALADSAMSPDRAFDPAVSRRLFSIAAPEFVTALIGGELIQRLRAIAPGVRFAIGHADEAEALRGLRTGEIDFALGRFGAARPGYAVEPLFEDVYCVVARHGHPAMDGRLDWEQWRDIGHVYAWSRSETGGDKSKDHGDGAPVMLAAVPQWLTALLMVASTDGIATVPRRLAERHAGRLGLQVIDPPFNPDRIEVSVMRRAGISDPGADWFLGEVRRAAAA